MATPAERFADRPVGPEPVVFEPIERTGDDWVSRRVASNGVVCVAWQQVSVGKHHVGARCDVHVGADLLQLWIGSELCRTVARTSTGEIRQKRGLRSRRTCQATAEDHSSTISRHLTLVHCSD
jgi:hypothetical protein